MTRLKADYQGFKLGLRVAESFALQASTTKGNDVAGLHAIKNTLHVQALLVSIQAFSINGKLATLQ